MIYAIYDGEPGKVWVEEDQKWKNFEKKPLRGLTYSQNGRIVKIDADTRKVFLQAESPC